MSKHTTHFVLLDLETTGLDPAGDEIIEVAALYLGTDIANPSIRARWHGLAYYSGLLENDYVRKMHTESGLLDAIENSVHTCADESTLLDSLGFWMRDLFDPDARSVSLVGDSVHFDHSFLAEAGGYVASRLSHRLVDVSGMSRVLSAWGIPVVTKTDKPAHRAMADCVDCFERLEGLRQIFGGGCEN